MTVLQKINIFMYVNIILHTISLAKLSEMNNEIKEIKHLITTK